MKLEFPQMKKEPFDWQKYLRLLDKWTHDYLSYNGCDIRLHITCPDNRAALVSSGREEDDFYIDMHAMERMPESEARMYIWGIIAKRDIITLANRALTERLQSAEDEYFEILDAQAIAEGKEPGEIQTLD